MTRTIELEGRYQILPLLDVGAAIDLAQYSGVSNLTRIEGSNYVITTVSVKYLIALNIYRSDIIKFSIVGGTSIRYFNHLFLLEFLVETPLHNNQEGVFVPDRQIILRSHFRPEMNLRLISKNSISFSASTTRYQKGNMFSGF